MGLYQVRKCVTNLVKVLDGQNIVQLVYVPIITTKAKKYTNKLRNKAKMTFKNDIKNYCALLRGCTSGSGRCGFNFILLFLVTINSRLHGCLCTVESHPLYFSTPIILIYFSVSF